MSGDPFPCFMFEMLAATTPRANQSLPAWTFSSSSAKPRKLAMPRGQRPSREPSRSRILATRAAGWPAGSGAAKRSTVRDQLLAHADHGDAAGERAGDQSLAQGQTDGEAGADQGGGASHEPEADPQARDVPGDLDGVEEGDHQGDGGGPAGEQARDLPAQPDQPAAGIVAEPGQDLRGEQAAEQEGGQGGGRHAGIEAPPGDGGAGDGHGQDVADPDEALDQGAGAGGGDAADPAAAAGARERAARRASATAPCRAEAVRADGSAGGRRRTGSGADSSGCSGGEAAGKCGVAPVPSVGRSEALAQGDARAASRAPTGARHPSSLRGVPSGLEGSKASSPW